MSTINGWNQTPSPQPVGPVADGDGTARKVPGAALPVVALVMSLIAMGVGIIAALVGVFCTVFIAAFGAPLEVTRPAMAGFAVRGSAITAVPFGIAVIMIIVAAVRRIEARWWVTLLLVNSLTLVGLGVAALIWFHPGHHVSRDFSS